jgi:peptidoglycan hydrolase-like protein with peptidoglycan-binding domain
VPPGLRSEGRETREGGTPKRPVSSRGAEREGGTPERPGSEREAERPASSRTAQRRRIVLIAVVALAVVASVGGLLFSTTIKSPAQQAAQSAPPPATQLTAPVTRQVITGTVLAQGVVKHPAEVAQLPGADTGGGAAGDLPVVTKIFLKRGRLVEPGNVIVEVAGQPLFVFQGSVPAYRNLVPGDSGTDVAQLQAGLEYLGYGIGSDTSGVFGSGTASAVAAYYTALGYPVPKVAAGPRGGSKPMVPLRDIMFVPRFPARVVKVAGPVGHEASGSLVTLSMGNPAIAGQLSPSDAALVKAGMAVTITDPATGSARPGRIGPVGTRTQTAGSISGGLYLAMKIDPSRPLPLSMIGQDVSLTITAAHSAGPVLAVPEAAVFARADGRLYVTKMTGARSQVQVPVRVGVTGDGFVGITPVDGGTLAAGDRVVIGTGYDQALRTAP